MEEVLVLLCHGIIGQVFEQCGCRFSTQVEGFFNKLVVSMLLCNRYHVIYKLIHT